MGARWYDAQIGRWVSADTIVPDPANPQGLNRYSYVLGNPLVYSDPTGHFPAWIPVLAAGGAILTTVTCAVTTDAFEWGEFAVAAGVGALGGALIGTGVGAAAWSALIAGVATGAGIGAIASAESYMITTDDFESTDMLVETGFGMAEGAVAGVPGVTPWGSAAISALAAGSESAVIDIVHGDPVEWETAASGALWGGVTGYAGAKLSGFAGLGSPGIDLGDGVPTINYIPPRSVANRLVAQAQRQAAFSVVRTGARETLYTIGTDIIYQLQEDARR